MDLSAFPTKLPLEALSRSMRGWWNWLVNNLDIAPILTVSQNIFLLKRIAILGPFLLQYSNLDPVRGMAKRWQVVMESPMARGAEPWKKNRPNKKDKRPFVARIGMGRNIPEKILQLPWRSECCSRLLRIQTQQAPTPLWSGIPPQSPIT